MVAAPSVFAKGARVVRSVSPKDLMACYDIEEETQSALNRAVGMENFSQDFVMEASLKVLCGTGRWIQQALGQVTIMMDSKNPDNKTVREGPKVEVAAIRICIRSRLLLI